MNRRRVLALARAEWIHNRRDLRSLIVILILPVVLLLIYGYGINFDIDNLPFAVYNLDDTQDARDLVSFFDQNRYFSLREMIYDRSRIEELMDQGAVVFVLVIPPDLGQRLGAAQTATVQVVADGSDTTRSNVALAYIQGALQDYSLQLSGEYLNRRGQTAQLPFSLHPTFLYNPGLESTQYIVPGLIAILLTLLAALITSTSIVREREWGSFESLVASPVRPLEIMVGKLLPYIAIAFADVLLSIIAGRVIFGVSPSGSVALLLGASVLYLLASLSIGLLFSVIARTQQLAILLAMLITMLPTILLSGFVFPLRSIPMAIRVVSYLIPATHFLQVIRGLYMKAAGFSSLWPQLLVLTGFAVGLVILAALRFQKRL